MNKIVIAGGTGFIGDYLRKKFQSLGYEVLVVSRNSGDVSWSNTLQLSAALNGAFLLINLAGKSVNCRFTESNKKALIDSRVNTTNALGDAIRNCETPPQLWINASGASIYNEHATEAQTERSLPTGSSFMAEVARQWEKAFYAHRDNRCRQVALRITLVLGRDGGVWPIYKKLADFGLAGTIGHGKQKMSWIHIEDLWRLIKHITENQNIVGAVNAAAPEVIENREFMRSVRKDQFIPFGAPAPAFILKMAAPVVGVDASLLLNSMWVYPEKILQDGFQFSFPTLSSAIADLRQNNRQ